MEQTGLSSEEKLILYLEGNDAFEAAGRQYLDELRSYVSPLLNRQKFDTATGDDIFQEAVIILFKKAREGGFKRESSLKTFFHGICRNVILEYWRNEKKRQKLNDKILNQKP
ncbi:MAG: hypothetical protein D6714_09150, partial [Bacteroidetes bacterium]